MHHGSVVIIGYARVSTREQQLAMQIDALKSAGCTRILTDVASGAVSARPGLDLGRSLSHLVSTVDDLAARGVFLRSLREAIDTTTAAGRLTFAIFASLAEFERELITERTIAGLEAARTRGAPIGRPTVWTPEKDAAATAMLSSGATVTQMAKALGVSRATIYRHIIPDR